MVGAEGMAGIGANATLLPDDIGAPVTMSGYIVPNPVEEDQGYAATNGDALRPITIVSPAPEKVTSKA
jgi:hypothetical protein